MLNSSRIYFHAAVRLNLIEEDLNIIKFSAAVLLLPIAALQHSLEDQRLLTHSDMFISHFSVPAAEFKS